MPRLVAESILSHVCGVSKDQVEFYSDLSHDEMLRADNLIERVLKGEPFEYVIGKVDFYGNELLLSKCALIPRSETELMLDFAAKRVREKGIETGVAVDLCCGSGCLGLGFKKAFLEFDVNLCDIDPSCIALAKDNAQRLGLDVRVLLGDFLEPLKAVGADVVLCNPPYVSEQEYEELDASVKDFEPKRALVAPDEGLYFYRKMAEELPSYLNPGALVFVEIGANQANQVSQIFNTTSLKIISCEKDLAGHDRFFFLENQ